MFYNKKTKQIVIAAKIMNVYTKKKHNAAS